MNWKKIRVKITLFKIFVSLFFLVLIMIMINTTLPTIYTPPALTDKRLEVFSKFVELAREHREFKELKSIAVSYFSDIRIRVGEKDFDLGLSSDRREVVEKYLSSDTINYMKNLSRSLKKVNCYSVEIIDNKIILFYTFPRFILSSPPGVIYSLDGEDPNKTFGPKMKRIKLFDKIEGNWYASRYHIMTRGLYLSPIPISIFDFSLKKPRSLKQQRE